MSTLKADAVTATTTNGDLVISGNGTGVPDIEAGFKVGGTAGLPINNLRVGTDGELITWDASGDPAAVAVGTATHVLTSNGAGAAPTFQAAGGGGLTLISETSITAVSSIDITGFDDSLYSAYQLIIEHVKPASEVFIQLQMSANGGSSFASTSGDYVYCGFQYNQSSTLVVSQNNLTGTSIYLSTKALRNDANGCYSVAFDILGTPSTSFTSIAGAASLTQVNGGIEAAVIGGRRTAAVLTDAVRLSMVSGNFAAQGFIRLFGLAT